VSIIRRSLSPILNGTASARSWPQHAGDTCQIEIQGVARYRIAEGRQILFDPAPGAAPTDIRLYLLGTLMGALLYQRGQLPLHVSALSTPSGLWAFTGSSGAGKSTLAADLHLRLGYPLFSDDVVVADLCPGDKLILHPGPPRLKLWEDALERFAIDKHTLVPDQTHKEKYHLQLEQGFCTEPQPLRSIVVLERLPIGESANLTTLKGAEAVQLLLAAALYRPGLRHRIGDPAQQFRILSTLVKQVNVYRYQRPWSLSALDDSLQPLLELIAESTGQCKMPGPAIP